MSRDILENLLQEFGGAIGIPELQVDEDGRCDLMFDDVAVSIELNKSEDAIYLYSSLGAAPTADSEALYASLLDANYLFRDTNGATLGVDSNSKRISLIREQELASIRLPQFEETLEEFVNMAENWQKKLVELAAGRTGAEPDEKPPAFDDSFALKV